MTVEGPRVGELCWLTPERPSDVAHPHVVLEVIDSTVRVCGLSSDLSRGKEPGNVLLRPGEGCLERQSVIIASHLLTVSAGRLGVRIGVLANDRVEEVERGLRFLESLRRRD